MIRDMQLLKNEVLLLLAAAELLLDNNFIIKLITIATINIVITKAIHTYPWNAFARFQFNSSLTKVGALVINIVPVISYSSLKATAFHLVAESPNTGNDVSYSPR